MLIQTLILFLLQHFISASVISAETRNSVQSQNEKFSCRYKKPGGEKREVMFTMSENKEAPSNIILIFSNIPIFTWWNSGELHFTNRLFFILEKCNCLPWWIF